VRYICVLRLSVGPYWEEGGIQCGLKSLVTWHDFPGSLDERQGLKSWPFEGLLILEFLYFHKATWLVLQPPVGGICLWLAFLLAGVTRTTMGVSAHTFPLLSSLTSVGNNLQQEHKDQCTQKLKQISSVAASLKP
jgi:hypothetical protein